MLPLKADFMPVSGFSLDEIPDQSRRAEGFFAAGRSVFREMWPHDAFVIEPAVASLAGDYLAGEPEAFERYKQDAKGSTALSRRLNSRKKEDYLPRFTREELESQGYAVHDAIEFEKDSDGQQRLSLPRFLVYTQSYEAQQEDQAIVGAMPKGLISKGVMLGGSLGASLADPINLIPFGTAINGVKATSKAGKAAMSVSRGATIGHYAKVGAIEGAMGAAVSDAVSFPLANRWGADVGLDDALTDIVISAGFGSFFGGLGAGLEIHANKLAEIHIEATKQAIDDMEQGLDPDVGRAIDTGVNQWRAAFDERMADPEYVSGLMRRQTKILDDDIDAFTRQLHRLYSGQGAAPLGNALVLGDSPPVLRMLDGGWSSLQMPVKLARDLAKKSEWRDIDIGALPRTIAAPVAVYDMPNGGRAILANIENGNGKNNPALITVQRELKELHGKRNAHQGDVVSRIMDIRLLRTDQATAAEVVNGMVNNATPVFVDRAKVEVLADIPAPLRDNILYKLADIKTSGDIPEFLAVEDIGVDLKNWPGVLTVPKEIRALDNPPETIPMNTNSETIKQRREAKKLELDLLEDKMEAELYGMKERGEITEKEFEDWFGSRAKAQKRVARAESIAKATECVIGGLQDAV